MKNIVKKTILSILLLITMFTSMLPIETKAAVRFDKINSVVLDDYNRLKSINFDYSWLGGTAYVSFVLLDGKIAYNGPDSLYGRFYLNASEADRKHTFQASLDYIKSLYPACDVIAHTGSPNASSSNQMPYSEGYTFIGSKTINFASDKTIDSNHSNKVYLYQWAYDGTYDGYYPDALVAVLEMKQDGLYYTPGDGNPNIKVPFTFSVSLNQNGGTGGTTNVTASAGSAMPSITVPTRNYYTFDGYYDGENGTGTKYYNANGTSAHVYDKGSSTTLYANWIPKTYNYYVVFAYEDLDGEYLIDSSKTQELSGPYGTVVTANSTTVDNIGPKTGFHYKDGKGNQLQIKNESSKNIITIRYDRDRSSVNFDTDDGKTVIETQNIKYQDTVDKPADPEKDGYRFVKWVKVDGDNEQDFKFSNEQNPDVVTEGITLKAKYELIDYPINYNLSDDKKGNNPSTRNVEEENITLNPPAKKDGYDFLRWENDKGHEVTELNSQTILDSLKDGEIFLKPVYKAKDDTPFTIVKKEEKLDGTYEEIDSIPATGTTDSKVKPSDYAGERDGFSLENNTPITITGDGKAELVIMYKRNTTKVNYNTDGGSQIASEENRKFGDTISGRSIEELKPTKKGYEFGGWTLNEKPCNPLTDTIPDEREITLNVVWNNGKSSYKIEIYLEKLDGTYELAETRTIYDNVKTNDHVSFSAENRIGYVIDTTNNNAVLEAVVSPNEDTCLKAYYKRKVQSVTFKTDDNDEYNETEEVKYGDITDEKETDEKQGYTKDGWETEDGVKFDFTKPVEDDVILRPRYIPNTDTPYTVIVYTMKDKDNYEKEVKQLEGTTDSEVEIDIKNLKGFKVNEEKSTIKGRVAADGSLVLEVYYDIYNPSIVKTGDVIIYVVIILLLTLVGNIVLRKRKREKLEVI